MFSGRKYFGEPPIYAFHIKKYTTVKLKFSIRVNRSKFFACPLECLIDSPRCRGQQIVNYCFRHLKLKISNKKIHSHGVNLLTTTQPPSHKYIIICECYSCTKTVNNKNEYGQNLCLHNISVWKIHKREIFLEPWNTKKDISGRTN